MNEGSFSQTPLIRSTLPSRLSPAQQSHENGSTLLPDEFRQCPAYNYNSYAW
jgi:hypothetical protein